MKVKLREFDPVNYLKTPEAIDAFLESALEVDDPDYIIKAISVAIRAQGMVKTAKKTGLDRAGLYHSFSEKGGNPQLKTLFKVIDSLGFRIRFERKPSLTI